MLELNGKENLMFPRCHKDTILPCLPPTLLTTTWSHSSLRVQLHKSSLVVSSLLSAVPSSALAFHIQDNWHRWLLFDLHTSIFVPALAIIFLSLKSHEFCLKLRFILALSHPFLLQCFFSASKQRIVIVIAVGAF